MMTRIAATMIAVLLSGCVGALPWNDQTCAGLDLIRVDLEAGQPTRIDICFGREKDLARFKVAWPRPDGDPIVITYVAAGTRAFKAHQIRAALERDLGQAGFAALSKAIGPGGIGKLIDLIMMGL